MSLIYFTYRFFLSFIEHGKYERNDVWIVSLSDQDLYDAVANQNNRLFMEEVSRRYLEVSEENKRLKGELEACEQELQELGDPHEALEGGQVEEEFDRNIGWLLEQAQGHKHVERIIHDLRSHMATLYQRSRLNDELGNRVQQDAYDNAWWRFMDPDLVDERSDEFRQTYHRFKLQRKGLLVLRKQYVTAKTKFKGLLEKMKDVREEIRKQAIVKVIGVLCGC
jgi:hypothetical protein